MAVFQTVVALSFCFSHPAAILASTIPQRSCLWGLVVFHFLRVVHKGQQRRARRSGFVDIYLFVVLMARWSCSCQTPPPDLHWNSNTVCFDSVGKCGRFLTYSDTSDQSSVLDVESPGLYAGLIFCD